MKNYRHVFVNELGNRIVISVLAELRDRDALCRSCGWRDDHAPSCKDAAEEWPMVPLDDGSVRIRIEGPTSVSENTLTSMEAEELRVALNGGWR